MKLKTPNKYLTILIILILPVCFYACHKMDSTYSEYVKNGEIIYIHKADSLKLYPGKNRVQLSWLKGIDSRAGRAMIYWNNGADSLEYIIQKTSDDSVYVLINNLDEGSYSFDVITYDNKGNSSVNASVSGSVYGDNYNTTLVNRKVKTAIFKNSAAIIDWYNAASGAVAIELTYKDTLGVNHIVLVPASEPETLLPGYKGSSEISYRTLFVPEEISIDTFYTVPSSFTPERPLEQLVKSKFMRWNPPGFPYTQYGAGYNIEKLWDDVYSAYGYIYLENLPLPRSFTFDMGQLAVLKRWRLSPNWEQQLYKNGNIKKCQVWGSATPEVTTDFSTWVFLGEFNSYKPSGLPYGQNTPEDLAYAKAGETFNITEDTPPLRYIRFVVEDTWLGTISMHITELTFWGYIE